MLMTKTFETISPVDGSVYVGRDFADEQHITQTISRSKAAQKKWGATPLDERIAFCQKALQYFEDNAAAIGEEITWQMGRPISQSPGEVRGLLERANYMISIAADALADRAPPQRDMQDRFISRQPVGTVFVIAPWNYPLLTAVNSIIPAILAGNAVILKHSTQTPLCAERFAAAFESAGLPEGVFNFLHLDYRSTENLIHNPNINYVSFTGSVAGGQTIQQAASQRFIGIGLELGGKDPAYVRADCNLTSTIENLVDGAFFNSGQSCCGIERIYVAESIYADFLEGFKKLTSEYNLGNPTDTTVNLGPVVRLSAAEFIREQIDEAIDLGAEYFSPTPKSDLAENYLQPHMLFNVNHNMRIMTEETFGPAVGIMPVKDDTHAIELMNDCDYGLTASIWTQDKESAIALGRHIETGTVFINRCDYLDPALPWTGVKNTGHGCSLSYLGFDQLTQAKSFNIN
jgi:acyl-CoA reductase-like NAD-dependent aldehyde dehydrogenase